MVPCSFPSILPSSHLPIFRSGLAVIHSSINPSIHSSLNRFSDPTRPPQVFLHLTPFKIHALTNFIIRQLPGLHPSIDRPNSFLQPTRHLRLIDERLHHSHHHRCRCRRRRLHLWFL